MSLLHRHAVALRCGSHRGGCSGVAVGRPRVCAERGVAAGVAARADDVAASASAAEWAQARSPRGVARSRGSLSPTQLEVGLSSSAADPQGVLAALGDAASRRDGTATASTSAPTPQQRRAADASSKPAAAKQQLHNPQQPQQQKQRAPTAAAATPPPPPAALPAHPLPPGVTAEHDKEIHDEIKACDDWRDVLDIVADEAELLSLRTAVLALTRLDALTRAAHGRQEMLTLPSFEALKATLFSQVPLMNNIQLSNSLYALAKLRAPVPRATVAAYCAAALAREATFYPRDIATLFAALAALRERPPQELMDALGYRAKAFMAAGQFEARTIPTLLHACVELGYRNTLLLAEAAAQAAAALGSMQPQGVANTLWALAKMDTYHPPAVAGALAALSARPLSYKPQEVANLLLALTLMRHHPQGSFAVFAQTLLHHRAALRAADIATALYAFAFFNVAVPPSVLDPLCARAGALLAAGSVSPVEAVHMYWGLGMAGEARRPLFGHLEGAVAKQMEATAAKSGGGLNEALRRKVFQGFLASRLRGADAPPAFSRLSLDALRRTWADQLGGYPHVRDGGKKYRPRVVRALQALKVKHDSERLTGDGLALIDVALRAGPERYIALQILEPTHFTPNTNQLLGEVDMMRRLIEKNGWEVKYVRASDLDRLSADVTPAFFAELLRSFGMKARAPKPAGQAAAAGGSGGAAAEEEEEP